MCKCLGNCFRSSVRLWLRVFNVLGLLSGLAVGGYGGYLAYKAPCPFVYMIIAMGGLMVIAALLGFYSVGTKNGGLLTLYGLFLSVLVLAQGALVICCLAEKDATLKWIKKTSDQNKDVEDVERFIRTHIEVLGIVFVGILGFEFVSWFAVICLRGSVLEDDDEEWERERAAIRERRAGKRPLLGGDGDSSATPQTDSQRARMVSKYGNRFSKRGGGEEMEFV